MKDIRLLPKTWGKGKPTGQLLEGVCVCVWGGGITWWIS